MYKSFAGLEPVFCRYPLQAKLQELELSRSDVETQSRAAATQLLATVVEKDKLIQVRHLGCLVSLLAAAFGPFYCLARQSWEVAVWTFLKH